MTVDELERILDPAMAGAEMYALIARLYPICRSITGAGFRETLSILQEHVPLEVHEVPSGTPVLDWAVPREWNIRDAYVKNAAGERVIDFRRHNLHVISYSTPVHATMSLADLRPHLYTLPDRPDWIPYRTSYYEESWGFCLRHADLLALPEGDYEVSIDSTLAPGSLTYGELYLPGASTDEVLISCHACHPSLCNDNLSGVTLAAQLTRMLQSLDRRLSYRFVFIPGTIGAITWLALNEAHLERIKHGLVLTGVGDAGPLTYKRSRRGDAAIDRAFAHVLRHWGAGSRVIDFFPYGYDERQYCSPGFNLPVGCLMRTQYGQYPEYHTSADNLDFVQPVALGDSFAAVVAALAILERDTTYVNLVPKGEPQLGRRGLYRAIHETVGGVDPLTMLWVLNLSDGAHSLLDIAERAGVPFRQVSAAADLLRAHGLLAEKEAA